jgi:hypothetical protein
VRHFDQTLKEAKEAFAILRRTDLCLFGCKDPKVEGPRAYWESSKVIDGKCSKCGKVRWTGHN